MDWQALLKKYIAYVGECEGTDFLAYQLTDFAVVFTPEEWQALQEVR